MEYAYFCLKLFTSLTRQKKTVTTIKTIVKQPKAIFGSKNSQPNRETSIDKKQILKTKNRIILKYLSKKHSNELKAYNHLGLSKKYLSINR